MSEVFDQTEFDSAYPPGIERHFWNHSRNMLIYRWVRRLTSQRDLVLDVGCATGVTVQALHQKGVNIRGVETGRPKLISGMEQYIDSETSVFDLDPELLSQVRVVLLLDVIEHMQDRQVFIRDLMQALPNCHSIVVTVPARQELWTQYDAHWGHFLRFNRQQLHDELVQCDLKVKRNAYFFNWLYLVSLAMKTLGIDKSLEFRPLPQTGLRVILHKTLSLITQLEMKLMPATIPGASLIAIAEVSDSPARYDAQKTG